MSGPFGSQQWMYNASSGFYPYEINNSLKFEDGDSSYLSRTPSSAGNRRTWTWSGWVKRGNISSSMELFNSAQSSGTQRSVFRFNSSNELEIGFNPTGSTWYYLYTDAVYRDASSWYHVVLSFDTTQATSSDRTKLYINGELQSFRSASYLSQNTEGPVNNTISHSIGRYQAAGTAHFDGYMTEVIFIDGTALDASSFGETKEGIWIPKDPTGLTYGTNGFRLPFTQTTSANGFNTVTYSGTGATQSIDGVGFQPDFIWIKERSSTSSHILSDTVRGATKYLESNSTDAEKTSSNIVTSFDADGFTTGPSGATNQSGQTYVGWCWGGGTNDKTYTVTVVDDSGNKYRFDGHGTSSITLELTEGATYTFNYPSAHPLRFSTTSDGTHGGGSEYTTGVTHVSYTQTTFTVPSGAPTLYYYCSQHSGMGGQVNTNTTDGPTHAEGTILSRVKPNADYGFSIVSYTGTGSAATVGHGLGVAPDMIIVKNRDNAESWAVFHSDIGATKFLYLNLTNAQGTSSAPWNDTAPTNSLFSVGTANITNASADDYVAYCFADVTGYQKVGSYSGTGSSGNAVTTGFKPAFLMIKNTTSVENWVIYDSTRSSSTFDDTLLANTSQAENTVGANVTFTNTGFTLDNTATITNKLNDNYIYLAIADTRDALFTSDASGNGNNWAANDLQHSDVMPDTPTDGFSTFNVLNKYSNITLTEGNLTAKGYDNAWRNVDNTIHVSSGKWYWEVYINNVTSYQMHGIVPSVRANGKTNFTADAYPGSYSDEWGYRDNGKLYNSASAGGTTWGSTYTTGDILGFALDMDAGTLDITKNGASTGSQITGISGSYRTCCTLYGSASKASYNFGQDSSFNANEIAQGNADGNGKGDFFYSPPSGYLALCNANLPDPAIDPNKGDNPENYFNTVLYTGNATTNTQITGVGFQPDWVWIKQRNGSASHGLFDSVRGTEKRLKSQATDAEQTSSDSVTSFDSDGFTVGNNTGVNSSGDTLVAWNWKAGGTAVTNDDGSIQSTVSANTEAGFSIISYIGNGTAGATVGHGLSQAPDMIIVKNRGIITGTNHDWMVYHSSNTSAPETDYLRLNLTNGTADAVSYWNDTAPTSSVITLGSGTNVNKNTEEHIVYCFHGVEGYSKFGSYTGNGSTDGPFVYTGFRPAFLLVKRSSNTGGWAILDNKRDTYNDMFRRLEADTSSAEVTSVSYLDTVSNGFKIRTTNGTYNTSAATYIYMAFAEQPFKYSNAR